MVLHYQWVNITLTPSLCRQNVTFYSYKQSHVLSSAKPLKLWYVLINTRTCQFEYKWRCKAVFSAELVYSAKKLHDASLCVMVFAGTVSQSFAHKENDCKSEG